MTDQVSLDLRVPEFLASLEAGVKRSEFDRVTGVVAERRRRAQQEVAALQAVVVGAVKMIATGDRPRIADRVLDLRLGVVRVEIEEHDHVVRRGQLLGPGEPTEKPEDDHLLGLSRWPGEDVEAGPTMLEERVDPTNGDRQGVQVRPVPMN